MSRNAADHVYEKPRKATIFTRGFPIMNSLLHLILLTMILMIYGIGHWVLIEVKRRQAWETTAESDRHAIRGIAEQAALETAARNAILEQFPQVVERPRLWLLPAADGET